MTIHFENDQTPDRDAIVGEKSESSLRITAVS